MTVGELKDRITRYEVEGWLLYEQEWGPLHLAVRFERAIAQIGAPFFKDEAGRPLKVQALMPWPKQEEKVATIEDVFGLLSGQGKKGKVKADGGKKPRHINR